MTLLYPPLILLSFALIGLWSYAGVPSISEICNAESHKLLNQHLRKGVGLGADFATRNFD